MVFSILNESSLHKSLKTIYSELYDGQTEVSQDGHVYDIVTKNGNIIEIQTKNLSKLLPKILDTIEKGHKIKLIHPIILTKRIEVKDRDGKLLSVRKSPKKENIYTIFRELTGIYPVLLNPSFSLEIVEIEMTEERLRTEEAVQSKNGRRRFRRQWIKSGKRLDQIKGTRKFNKAEDYLSLIPALKEPFCAKDLKTALIKNQNELNSRNADAHLIIWVLKHMELIELKERKKNVNYYCFRKN